MPKPLSAKDKILAERGLKKARPSKNKVSHITHNIKPTYQGITKTPLMKYLEQKYHQPIEDVLTSGSLSVVAKSLGNEVDVTTISKWIARFRLRYNKDNLPLCLDCKRVGPACEVGVCYILMDLERYDLIEIKKEEVLNAGNQIPNPTTE